MNVYIVNGSGAYVSMFAEKFHVVDDIKHASLVCFTGGSDVTPALYNQPRNPHTYCNDGRDLQEIGIFNYCQANGLPMVGICRGGQFLNVMCGGSMYQHVTGHAQGNHMVKAVGIDIPFIVSSTHHQMMLPHKDAHVLAYADGLSGVRTHWDGKLFVGHTHPNKDAEVVYYAHKDVLCFQPHPEFGGVPECRDYFFKCVTDLMEVRYGAE